MSCDPVAPPVAPVPARWIFGKLPAQGDFVARGLDAARRARLDEWLAREMDEARTLWSPAEFDARYAAAPAWHFVERDHAGSWWGGVLCASMDRVGRCFPLAMAANLAAEAAGAADADTGPGAAAAALSAGCLSAVAQAFAEGWSVDQLHVAPLDRVDLPWSPEAPGWALVGADGPVVEREGTCPDGVVLTMMEQAA